MAAVDNFLLIFRELRESMLRPQDLLMVGGGIYTLVQAVRVVRLLTDLAYVHGLSHLCRRRNIRTRFGQWAGTVRCPYYIRRFLFNIITNYIRYFSNNIFVIFFQIFQIFPQPAYPLKGYFVGYCPLAIICCTTFKFFTQNIKVVRNQLYYYPIINQ